MKSSQDRNSVSGSHSQSPVRSALRYAFVPRIGRNVGEIGRTMGLFPRMLANVFVMQGLFPHNHPALRDASMRLRMTEVFAAAFSRLEWNRSGLPKILFFLAVAGSVAFSLAAFAFAIMGFFTVSAHAAPIFTAPDPTTDLSNNWLEHVFNGAAFTVQVPTYGAGFSPGLATIPQTFGGGATSPAGMFRSLAAFYSNAMLVLAVIIVVYHLLSMVVHTAHDGTPMGRGAHQIWTPVRFVFALGLLVPVAGGFSSGQWLVMWLAQQGSGLASNVWGNPAIGGNFVSMGTRVVSKPDTQPAAMIDQLYTIGYCAKEKQMLLAEDRGYYIGNNEFPAGSGTYPAAQNATPADAQDVRNALAYQGNVGPAAASITSKLKTVDAVGATLRVGANSRFYYPTSEVTPLPSGTFRAAWSDQPCGSVMFSAQLENPSAALHPEIAAVNAVAQAHVVAFNAIELDALQLGATLAARKHRREGGNGLNTFGFAPNPANGSGIQITDSRQQLMNAYRAAYQAALPALPGLVYDANSDRVIYTPPPGTPALVGNTGLGGAGDLGWMSAGGYFISMATKGNRFTNSAALTAQVAACEAADDLNCPAREALEALEAQTRQEEERNAVIRENTGGAGMGWLSFLKYLNEAAMEALAFVGLANDQNQLMWHTIFGSPYPLSDMINLGQQLVDAAFMLMYIGIGFTLIASVKQMFGNLMSVVTDRAGIGGAGTGTSRMSRTVSKAAGFFSRGGPLGLVVSVLSDIAGAVAPVFFAFAGMLIIPGVMLLYLLPLLPFLNFLTGIITWMVSLLQAVVAIPVIAIAHLTPNGEGLPSGAARGAYVMMLQIFLRPVMMIFGLIVCVLIINTGIGLLNGLFFNIFKQTLDSHASGFFANLIFFMLYAGACWSIVNAAITAIDDLPLKAVTWIGGGQGVDTNHDFGSTSQILAGAVAAKSFGAISDTARGLASSPATATQGIAQNAQSNITQRQQTFAQTAQYNANELRSGNTAGYNGMTGQQRMDVANGTTSLTRLGGNTGGAGGTMTPPGGPAPGGNPGGGLIMPSGVGSGPRSPAQQSSMMDAAGMRPGSTGLGMDGRGNGGQGAGPFLSPTSPRGGGTPGGSRALQSIRGAGPLVRGTALPVIAGRLTGSNSLGSAASAMRLRGGMINQFGQRYGIDPRFLAAQQAQESGAAGTNAVSHVGARGVAQFMPATAREYNVNVNDDASSTRGQAQYMRVLSDRYDGDMIKATAAYNWGMGNVDRAVRNHGANWLSHAPQETQQYVARIDGYMRQDFGVGLTGAAPGQLPQGFGYGTANAGADDAGVPQHMLIAESMLGANENLQRTELNEYLAGAGVRNSIDGRSLVDVSQTAWCAGFVDASLRRAGLQGTGSLAASSYENFGMDARGDARVGDIVTVDWNGDGTTDHVAFIAGVNSDGSFRILGGNQTDRGPGRRDGEAVTMSRVSASQVTAIRRAPGAEAGGTSWQGGEAYAQQPQPISAMESLVGNFLGLIGGGGAPAGIDPTMAPGVTADGQPVPQQEAPRERGMVSTIGHGILGLASFIPGVSIIAGGIDAAWYTAEGDYANAALAGVSMIPGGKWVTTAGRVAYRGARAAGAGVRMSRVAARTTAVGARTARGAGSLARQMRGWGALGGGGGGSGVAPPTKDDGMDWYMVYLTKKALDYAARKGTKAPAGSKESTGNLVTSVGLNS